MKQKEFWFKDKNGQAMTEYALIMVLIVSCISVIAYLSGLVKNKAESSICRINCVILESEYETYLTEKDGIHSDTLYYQFVQSDENGICPKNYPVIYVNGKIECSGHSDNNTTDNDEGNNDESIPFL